VVSRRYHNKSGAHLYIKGSMLKGAGNRVWEYEYSANIYCVHMYVSEKMRPVETTPGKGEEG
jgi:hypothetical protein